MWKSVITAKQKKLIQAKLSRHCIWKAPPSTCHPRCTTCICMPLTSPKSQSTISSVMSTVWVSSSSSLDSRKWCFLLNQQRRPCHWVTTHSTSPVPPTSPCSAPSGWCKFGRKTLLSWLIDTLRCRSRRLPISAISSVTCSSTMPQSESLPKHCSSYTPAIRKERPFLPPPYLRWWFNHSYSHSRSQCNRHCHSLSTCNNDNNRSSSASTTSMRKSALARSITCRHRNLAVSSSPPPNRSQRSNGTPSPYHSQSHNQLIFRNSTF